MSFEAGPIKQPLIQNSQRMQNNGGGGNLGYMNRGKGGKKNSKEDEEKKLLEEQIEDSLQLKEGAEDFKEDDSPDIDFKQLFAGIKNKFSKVFSSQIKKETNNPFSNTTF
jgi:hypothetical protein